MGLTALTGLESCLEADATCPVGRAACQLGLTGLNFLTGVDFTGPLEPSSSTFCCQPASRDETGVAVGSAPASLPASASSVFCCHCAKRAETGFLVGSFSSDVLGLFLTGVEVSVLVDLFRVVGVLAGERAGLAGLGLNGDGERLITLDEERAVVLLSA